MPIRVALSDSQAALPIDRRRLRDVVRKTLQAEGIREADISLAVVDDPTIHRLNRRHLAHDYPTDVLSFLLSGSPAVIESPAGTAGSGRTPSEPNFVPPGVCLEGEVIVSADTAIRQAAVYGWSPEAELTLYIVHGLLHLCGYDDHSRRDRATMRSRERAILQIWGLSPHYDD